VTATVALSLGDGVEIVSIITRRSRDELGLAVGKPAIALIKSSFVSLATGEILDDRVNRLAGVVVDREDGAAASEISLALTAGKTLVATVSHDISIPAPGERVVVVVEPSNVILAVE
jgi:molybdate transport system regulatory protein